tara:strand:- start:147 stop:785 length:639 start_codon:yes stop_codon:yes gene_type:complete
MNNLCLVSTGGDMSSRGMGDKNTVYVFPYKYKKQVDDFLKAQCNYNLSTYNDNFGKRGDNSKKYYKKLSETFDVLMDLKIFTSKYDFRTTWEMCFLSELEEFKPYEVIDKHKVLAKKPIRLIRTSKKSICNWFGDRGIDINSSNFVYKVLYNPNLDNNWIFINVKTNDIDNMFNKKEVELYYLNSEIAECFDSWDRKGFSWSKKNLEKLLPK